MRQSVNPDSITHSNLWPESVINLDRPIVFHSLAEAREMLEIYTHYHRQRSTELQGKYKQAKQINVASLSAVALRDISLSLLRRWSGALNAFLHKHSASLTDCERRGAAQLQLRQIDSFIALDVTQTTGEAEPDDQIRWDRYNSVFEQMVALGESINEYSHSSASSFLSSSSSSGMPPSSPTTFSLDLGIVGVMFNVATRCRDPHIRRRAICVLRAAAVQEGIWNSVVVAAIAEKWIEIEEEGLGVVASCADVPSAARLSHVLPMFDVAQCSAQLFFSHPPQWDSGGVRREVLQW